MLVKEKRLEILQGGWVASDEATPNYEDMILNMQKGHAFLQKEFGFKPKVGWMIDAFGHTMANARLFADFGFESAFYTRIADAEKEERKENKTMGYVWKPFAKHFGDEKQIYIHIFPDAYGQFLKYERYEENRNNFMDPDMYSPEVF